MTHTPGPWTVSDENRDDLQRFARFGNVVVYAEQDCDIHPIADCSCNHSCRVELEQIANARLIAAAPDLLEALKALVETSDPLPHAWAAAHFAIAKAEGQT